MSTQPADSALDKDQPLREDIRLLGRLLGETVREREGEAVFDTIENIRQLSLRYHRDEDKDARRELVAVLDALSLEETSQVVRAFSYFSHLANIAEDQHHIRRGRAHALAGSPPREGELRYTLQRALDNGVGAKGLADFFGTALVSPVLTAHPTEVQRKSILDCQWAIASVLEERDRTMLTPEELAAREEMLRREVLTLWQTRLLRKNKLSVMDEVSNALTYYETTFLK